MTTHSRNFIEYQRKCLVDERLSKPSWKIYKNIFFFSNKSNNCLFLVMVERLDFEFFAYHFARVWELRDVLIIWNLRELSHRNLKATLWLLTIIFNQSLSEQQLPRDWLTANICPVFKKGARSTASNYRPISLTCVICKTMEHILYHHIMAHLEQLNILKDYQHGFRKGRSCETQLIITVDEIAKSLDYFRFLQGIRHSTPCKTFKEAWALWN